MGFSSYYPPHSLFYRLGFPPVQVAFMALMLSMGAQILLPVGFTALFDAVSGQDLTESAQSPETLSDTEATAYKLMIVLTQALGIGLVGWLFAAGSGHLLGELRLVRRPPRRLLFLSAGAMLAALPFIQYTVISPENFSLPDGFEALEEALRQIETRNDEMMRRLLSEQLPLNLLVVAVTPALMEEVLFRGLIQSSLMRGRSVHVAIFVTGVLFSAIHLQVFGFVGRALLGIGFGYLCWWSGSLWPAVVAHFTNNAVGVLTAWILANEDETVDLMAAGGGVSFGLALASLVLTLILMNRFRRWAAAQYPPPY